MNDFKTDLEYSLETGEDKLFNNFYKRLFGNIKIEKVEDIKLQFKGVDKIIHFPSGKYIYIDEKKRRKDYGDIIVEIWSNTENKVLGWAFKPYTDYIVYAIMPTRKVYLLPSLILKIWLKSNWLILDIKFKKVVAQNKGYTTTSYAIPTEILLKELKEIMVNKLF